MTNPFAARAAAHIAPGLALDHDLYAAAAGIADNVPDLAPLDWAEFTSPGWTLIPDESTGRAYKAEIVLVRTRARTVKLNLWFEPDLRDPSGPRPHNHPWDFCSAVLSGTYVEDRWSTSGGVVVPDLGVEHRAGQINKVGREVFHEVVEVDPARTLTLMMCGPGMAGWGYLDPETAEITRAAPPPGFAEQLRRLNPHQR